MNNFWVIWHLFVWRRKVSSISVIRNDCQDTLFTSNSQHNHCCHRGLAVNLHNQTCEASESQIACLNVSEVSIVNQPKLDSDISESVSAFLESSHSHISEVRLLERTRVIIGIKTFQEAETHQTKLQNASIQTIARQLHTSNDSRFHIFWSSIWLCWCSRER
jgi:hypothetical protein